MQVPEPFTRPDSGIRIYEIQDSSEANPHPDSDNEKSFGEFLSPIKLVRNFIFLILLFLCNLFIFI